MEDVWVVTSCLTIPVVIIVILFIIQQRSSRQQQRSSREEAERTAKELKDAHETYRRCLANLKNNPTDPELRERTLEWGRHYSNLTRQRQGVTIFDEVALSNDIAAACAAAGRFAGAANSEKTLETRLRKLDELHASGTINDEEYRQRRGQILAEI